MAEEHAATPLSDIVIAERMGELKKGGTAYKVGFWFLLLTLLGFLGGMYFAQHVIIEKRLADAVKLQGIVINSQPYDLKAR